MLVSYIIESLALFFQYMRFLFLNSFLPWLPCVRDHTIFLVYINMIHEQFYRASKVLSRFEISIEITWSLRNFHDLIILYIRQIVTCLSELESFEKDKFCTFLFGFLSIKNPFNLLRPSLCGWTLIYYRETAILLLVFWLFNELPVFSVTNVVLGFSLLT